MKKYSMLALVFVLTAMLLTGCRDMGPGTSPTTSTPAATPGTSGTTTPLPTQSSAPSDPGDVLPDKTDPPDTSSGNGDDMTRGRPRPRY